MNEQIEQQLIQELQNLVNLFPIASQVGLNVSPIINIVANAIDEIQELSLDEEAEFASRCHMAFGA